MKKQTATLFLALVLLFAIASPASAKLIGDKRNKTLHNTQHKGCKMRVKRKIPKKNQRVFRTKKRAISRNYNSCNKCRKRWVTLKTMEGNDSKRSSLFRITAKKAKLYYNVKGNPDWTLVYVYVMKKGAIGGFPVASIYKPGKGVRNIYEPKGKYYLEVISANASWSIKIRERR